MKLKDICSFQSGGTPSKNNPAYFNGSIPWVTTVALNGKTVNENDAVERITEQAILESAAKIVPAYSIMVGTRVGVGKTAINTVPMATSQDIVSLIGIDESVWNKSYITKFIQSKSVFLKSQARGATIKGIKIEALADISINNVPKKEQENIVLTMDRVQKIISDRQQELQLLDDLIKSRFIEMFEGKAYPILRWNDVFNTKTGKLDSNAMVEGGQYPFFTCAKEIFAIDKYAFDQEALLLAGNNAVGKYDVKYYKGKFNAYQRTYVLDLKQNWSYQLFKFQLEDKLEWLREQSKGCNTRYITLKILAELEFIIPPIELQNEFELFVKQIDKSKFIIQQSIDKLETLQKALMQKYFG